MHRQPLGCTITSSGSGRESGSSRATSALICMRSERGDQDTMASEAPDCSERTFVCKRAVPTHQAVFNLQCETADCDAVCGTNWASSDVDHVHCVRQRVTSRTHVGQLVYLSNQASRETRTIYCKPELIASQTQTSDPTLLQQTTGHSSLHRARDHNSRLLVLTQDQAWSVSILAAISLREYLCCGGLRRLDSSCLLA